MSLPLRMPGVTKQFCPLPRKPHQPQLENRIFPRTTLVRSSCRSALQERSILMRRLRSSAQHNLETGREVAPTTTFVLFRAMLQLG
jgi:hypothetical protein